jgi:CubicO group peptidase (beta-lactamase class C family)
VGLGWHISRPVDRDIVWHNGQTGGSHGLIALDQARHTAVVVLSNSVSSIDDIGVNLLDERVELAAAEERPELTLAAEVLERSVGV